MENSVLVVDEPALHLHPIKIRLLSKFLRAIRRQVIIITHSPFFMDLKLFENNESLIYIVKDKNDKISNIINKPANFKLKLKPYIFNPEIFFSKICLFVEGPSDEYAIKAIDDNLNNILEKNDILVVNVGGKNNVEPYMDLIENYNLPHIIMVDGDYRRRQTIDTIKLPRDLEDVMRKIGWVGKGKKITAEEAYEVVASAMKSNPKSVKTTEIGKVFDEALKKVGVNACRIW
jgi:predicted ATP-dependent endonuclease of OLD family